MTDSITTELPLAPGVWTLDQPHCTVEFTARHMGISKVRGRFHEFDATLTVGDALATSRLEASVELSSVDTRNPDRDAHLRSSDYGMHFNVPLGAGGVVVSNKIGIELDVQLLAPAS